MAAADVKYEEVQEEEEEFMEDGAEGMDDGEAGENVSAGGQRRSAAAARVPNALHSRARCAMRADCVARSRQQSCTCRLPPHVAVLRSGRRHSRGRAPPPRLRVCAEPPVAAAERRGATEKSQIKAAKKHLAAQKRRQRQKNQTKKAWPGKETHCAPRPLPGRPPRARGAPHPAAAPPGDRSSRRCGASWRRWRRRRRA